MSGARRVADDDAGIRLDRWFRRHYPALGHVRLEKLLRTGQVRVDGARARASLRLLAGQLIRVPPLGVGGAAAPAPLPEADREWIRSLVLHRDDDVIVLDKPPGIAVQGGRGTTRHIDRLLPGLAETAADGPRLVHRLDRDTSGVLLVARRASVAAALAEAFRGREVEKVYWALVAGAPRPARGVVDAALAKRPAAGGGERVAVDPAMGRPAVTEYEVADRAGRKAAWLVLRPRTGRTHQLRAHCAALGAPIVGDRKYGGAAARIDGLPGGAGLHLHARSVRLPHPAGGTLRAAAPLPAGMAAAWRFLGFDPEAGA